MVANVFLPVHLIILRRNREALPTSQASAIPVLFCSYICVLSAVGYAEIGSTFSRVDTGNTVQRREEVRPGLPLFVEDPSARGSHFVVSPASLSGFLNPPPLDPSSGFEPVKHRIERCDVELEHTFGSLLDQLGDFVTVAWPILYQRQYQHLGASSFHFLIEHM
jgi:hypothetical protein